MRASAACIVLVSASLAAGAASAQLLPSPRTTGTSSANAAPSAPPAPAPAPAVAPAPASTCANPDAIGVSRTVEIDTTGGPGFGFEHFRQHDFLKNKEVVLTFDDGPWLDTTPKVLKALADQCTKATFFPIGKHATYYPEILKQVAEAGHSVGNHTWSHQDLAKKGMTVEKAKEEIEKGISAVRASAGQPTAPFFRFPALRHPPELVTYLGERNIAIFSTDMDSFDFTARKPEQVINKIMSKLEKHGKGIVLMHDFQKNTAEAVADLLKQLKDKGYKIVHMKARDPIKTLPQYDQMLVQEQKLPTVSQRPTASVVRTIEGN
ncbi:MAG: polysaccharide deacetylase family protein [Pseudorhodoplanes sp.]|nr:polysaccharide deacetylase family protein [Pseudorhodoplanes sp.]